MSPTRTRVCRLAAYAQTPAEPSLEEPLALAAPGLMASRRDCPFAHWYIDGGFGRYRMSREVADVLRPLRDGGAS